ncbi:DnaJ family domain-containing protein [Paenibacillus sp. Marseille-Q4541]|uniref:DnaJ family domain-containing protein n=1 Tax=Paenibacillus sp. Marseille-Q4541 TaxID=2831522 RepID=UPI001BAD7FE0
MGWVERLAEQKIAEAMERGDLDNLPGMGKPLELEDLSHVPEELRASYKILKNAGVLPEELLVQQDTIQIQQLIAACTNNTELHELKKRLTEQQLRVRLLLEQRGIYQNPALAQYESQIRARLED